MKKRLFGILALVSFATADNAWITPATVKIIRQQANGRCFFRVNEAPANSKWFVFDGNSAAGKNFLSILTAAKASGKPFQFYETTPASGMTNTWNVDNITLGLDI